jgi:hypothetical protein
MSSKSRVERRLIAKATLKTAQTTARPEPGPWQKMGVDEVLEACLYFDKIPSKGYLTIDRAWYNNQYKVTARIVESSEWGPLDLLSINHHEMKRFHPWTVFMNVKRSLLADGADRVGIQVFPKDEDVIDQANTYHFYVLPKGQDLPFKLLGQY